MVRRGGTALEQGRGLSPRGAISKWEPPAMTSPLSVNHLCLISPPGALQSKYECGRPTKTVGCIRRISQAARVLHRRGAGLIIRARRRQLSTVQKSHRGEEEKWENGRIRDSAVEPWPSKDVAKPDESGITLHCEQGRAASAVSRTSGAEVIHTQFTCSFRAFTLII